MDSETTQTQDAAARNRERCRGYYARNRLRIIAYGRAYTEAHKEKVADRRRKYQIKNRKRLSAKSATYYAANKDKIDAYNAEYRKANAEIIAAYHAKYGKTHRAAHKERIKKVTRRWWLANKAHANAVAQIYRRNRYKSDPSYKVVVNLRSRIKKTLKAAVKSKRSLSLIGTTPEKLRQHLESLFLPGMSWEYYGLKGWHIDHIVPCAAFDLSDPAQQRRCFHWSNLRPLWAKTNIKKGAQTDGQFHLPLTSVEAMEA